MWQDDFVERSDVPVGEVHLNSLAEMGDFIRSRLTTPVSTTPDDSRVSDMERFILLRTKVNKSDISITDEFEGVFLQEGFYFILSK